MKKKDWILLALLAAKDYRLQPVQLQKSLFLLSESGLLGGRSFYKFEPYHYGPFSHEVYKEADRMVLEGLIVVLPVPGVRWREYWITEEGKIAAEKIATKPEQPWEYLKLLVTWIQDLSFQDLIKTIYAHFPAYKVNSVFGE